MEKAGRGWELKVDPEFSKDDFLRFAESVIIPNVLEAELRGDLGVLGDWCHENKEIGYSSADSRVLDITRVELHTGKMMDQGPILIITFSAHCIFVLKNKEGKVIEGDADTVVKMNHVWALCRDMMELNPMAAWKVLEIHRSPAPMTV